MHNSKLIHATKVQNYLSNRPANHINKQTITTMEQTVPRKTRRTLAQLEQENHNPLLLQT
jgi:hypothetical protein